ncbi:MAG: RNA polymerase sigma factor [Bacillota bacterium]|nr:RNA polymerase sigma factor [Bacillota bacterium]
MVNDLHQIIIEAKKGDQNAFRQLVTAYKGTVFRHAFSLLNDRMEAEDVTQEAFVKAYYSLPKLENEFAFVSWLTRVVTNLCYDKNKKLNKKKLAESEELIENVRMPNASSPIEQSIAKMTIKEAMEKIPLEQKNVLILREIQGYSYSEISELLQIPLGTVKSRINTARENLRKELEKG